MKRDEHRIRSLLLCSCVETTYVRILKYTIASQSDGEDLIMISMDFGIRGRVWKFHSHNHPREMCRKVYIPTFLTFELSQDNITNQILFSIDREDNKNK